MSLLLEALAGVLNACEPVPGLVTGGQPGTEHLNALKRAGCQVVIDMRDPMEPQPIDAPGAVRAAALDYLNISVSHSAPEGPLLERVRKTVGQIAAKGQKVFAYCNSGNRVGAVLIPYLMLDRGMSEDAAVALALRMGTRSNELIEGALDYVKHSGADG
jgi:protein tyrosine phosphatase (PTP) superfamily phosphohydrolase (DUF442 family)